MALRSWLACSSAARAQSGYAERERSSRNTKRARLARSDPSSPSGSTNAATSCWQSARRWRGRARRPAWDRCCRAWSRTVAPTWMGIRRGGGHSSALAASRPTLRCVAPRRRAERVADGHENAGRGTLVATLLEAHEVVDADAGQRPRPLRGAALAYAGARVGEADVAGSAAHGALAGSHRALTTCWTQGASARGRHPGPAATTDQAGLPDLRQSAHRGSHDEHPTTTLPLAAGRWALDTNHSSVGFTIRHLGVSKVRGRFNAFDGGHRGRRRPRPRRRSTPPSTSARSTPATPIGTPT